MIPDDVWRERTVLMEKLCHDQAPRCAIALQALDLISGYGWRRTLWFVWKVRYWGKIRMAGWLFWHRTVHRKTQAEIEALVERFIDGTMKRHPFSPPPCWLSHGGHRWTRQRNSQSSRH